MTASLRSSAITAPSSLLRTPPPLCSASVLWSLRRRPLGFLPSHRNDRFLCSLSKPVSRSRRLHAGRRLGSRQAPPNPCSRDRSPNPGFDVDEYVTTRHQRFTCVRLLEPHLTEFLPPFPTTLTTRALYPRSLWRFGTCPCRPIPEGLPPSSIKLRRLHAEARLPQHTTSSYLRLRHSRSTKMLSMHRPLPSMLIVTLCRFRVR